MTEPTVNSLLDGLLGRSLRNLLITNLRFDRFPDPRAGHTVKFTQTQEGKR